MFITFRKTKLGLNLPVDKVKSFVENALAKCINSQHDYPVVTKFHEIRNGELVIFTTASNVSDLNLSRMLGCYEDFIDGLEK